MCVWTECYFDFVSVIWPYQLFGVILIIRAFISTSLILTVVLPFPIYYVYICFIYVCILHVHQIWSFFEQLPQPGFGLIPPWGVCPHSSLPHREDPSPTPAGPACPSQLSACALVSASLVHVPGPSRQPSTCLLPYKYHKYPTPWGGQPLSAFLFPNWLACGSRYTDPYASDPGVLFTAYREVALSLITSAVTWVWIPIFQAALGQNFSMCHLWCRVSSVGRYPSSFKKQNKTKHCGWHVTILLGFLSALIISILQILSFCFLYRVSRDIVCSRFCIHCFAQYIVLEITI